MSIISRDGSKKKIHKCHCLICNSEEWEYIFDGQYFLCKSCGNKFIPLA